MKCDENCNYYTEQYRAFMHDNVPYCIKLKRNIKVGMKCLGYDDTINCYDCPNRYSRFYDVDIIDHYCRITKKLIYEQQRSVLYKGDFEKCNCE